MGPRCSRTATLARAGRIGRSLCEHPACPSAAPSGPLAFQVAQALLDISDRLSDVFQSLWHELCSTAARTVGRHHGECYGGDRLRVRTGKVWAALKPKPTSSSRMQPTSTSTE